MKQYGLIVRSRAHHNRDVRPGFYLAAPTKATARQPAAKSVGGTSALHSPRSISTRGPLRLYRFADLLLGDTRILAHADQLRRLECQDDVLSGSVYIWHAAMARDVYKGTL